ncbi:FMN oxidoreductase [Gregarina niphandrodes]|uniref:FMN oxidoreductase n=1 Tax=Gregarina niphandrodes TaxID=110365 RepID=A0A023B7N8_GRENI|nr:FMN oxidoreductase [Gregarina niphandrodes]EZG67513.1 FMN oxidoreductase [Gregarina niphandrodes]|eukprot:XP_011130228.1 FMN oxidoreductase [Gregarina niphandrodes]
MSFIPVPKLFTPYRIRGLELVNKVVVAPMCTWFADPETNMINDAHLVHYGSLSLGGAGLLMFEGTAVEKRGCIAAGDAGLWNDEQAHALTRLTSFVHHQQSAKIGIQLAHAGRKALVRDVSVETAAPSSAISSSAVAYDVGWRTPVAMTKADIVQITETFAAAARRAVVAGFDWVEIHNAHGYLLNQFTSPLVNCRTDEYGGSLENRCRLSIEVVQAVRRAIPESMPLSVRISCVDWVEGGWQMEDSVYLARSLCAAGVDLIHVSSGGVSPGQVIVHSWDYQLVLSAQLRAAASVKTIAVGGIANAEEANDVLVNEDADLVAVGREHLKDPYWTRHQAAVLGLPHWFPPYQALAYRKRARVRRE